MKIKFFTLDVNSDCRKIFVRVRAGRSFDRKAWTEKYVLSENWDAKKQEVTSQKDNSVFDITDEKQQLLSFQQSHKRLESAINLNAYLNNLKNDIILQFNLDNPKGLTLEKDWLKKLIQKKNESIDLSKVQKKDFYLTDWIEDYLSNPKNLLNSKTGKPLSKETIKSYKSVYHKLLSFEAFEKKHFRFEDLSYNNFYKSLMHYLRNIEKLNENTIGKHISVIKTYFSLIKDDSKPINTDFEQKNKFSTVSEETSEYYLNDKEIDKIFKLDLSDNPRLDNVRDTFIIGLWTGLRISDFKRLDIENIKDGIISITTQKTHKRVAIGMHPQLKAVLEKRGGEFPKKISDQKFNEYVKEVVKLAGIDELLHGSKKQAVEDAETGISKQRKIKGIYPKYELISSHTCRRSFATNLYKTKALPLLTLMSLTGHKTESQFLEYIKISAEENAILMNDYYAEKLNKQNLVAPLKVV